MNHRHTDGVFSQPLILIQRFETASCFDGEPNGLSWLNGKDFSIVHDDGAVDDIAAKPLSLRCFAVQ